jgi:tRNA(Ile)-lysidine synthase
VGVRQELTAERSAAVLEEAHRFGGARDALVRDAARLLAEAGQAHEAGYFSLDLAPLAAARPGLQAVALRQAMLAISGADYAPMPAIPSLEALTGRTLGGCLLQVLRERLYVFREPAAIRDRIGVTPAWSGAWDNRFGVQVLGDLAPGESWTVAPLGERGLRQAVDRFGIRLKRYSMPLPARLALPALWRGEHLAAQPHLHLGQGLAAWPAPRHTVTTCGFTVAGGQPHTIYSPVVC